MRDFGQPASPVGRRTVLLAAGGMAFGVAGCSSNRPHATAAESPASPSGLPRATPWHPSPDDVDPQVKLRAVQLIEALGNWRTGEQGAAAARRRVSALGLDPSLVGQAGPLLASAEEAVVRVVDAQYGGILADAASVLVVCQQWTRQAGAATAGGTTVDVRLSRARPRWAVTALHPARPGPAVSSLPAAARKVLDDPHVGLPPAARADVRSGHIHTSVLEALLRLADTYRINLSVIRSGHPLNVFGTARPSDHPRGRAFDVWQINGRPVVDSATPRRLIESFMRDAAMAGSYNVGGPVLPSGAGAGRFFSDPTHHDHVHVGFRS
ncbi:hypothetical protein JHN59_02310 [Streptomyces sp. MBT49]|uniref:hypothetical protein n=1 Tax=Streptomyces sp. MBT49 TaxID=1488380 RepID=UPI00190DA651|nr:hypothetical protein [Streptomyces sp. MBT49]MBK3623689.1 hypothetical protein [Streptomyces sp. MBT49]